jgi:hypothetical protein
MEYIHTCTHTHTHCTYTHTHAHTHIHTHIHTHFKVPVMIMMFATPSMYGLIMAISSDDLGNARAYRLLAACECV